jgi:protein-tyrosine kinase
LDRSVRTSDQEVDFPRVAVASRPRSRTLITDANPSLEGKLVVSREVSRVSAEQYRRLADALHDIQDRSAWTGPGAVERGLKTLLVTSALPGDGKTLTVVNLALTLSESYGRRVLLIDANLRHPSIHEVLNLPNTIGLSDVLCSDKQGLPLQEVAPLLSVLPAGHANGNPTAELASDRMRWLLNESASRFDWVLLDAPPVGLPPDAQLVARLTRAVLFVIGSGSTPYRVVSKAIAELGRGCIIGTVLNRIKEHTILATSPPWQEK